MDLNEMKQLNDREQEKNAIRKPISQDTIISFLTKEMNAVVKGEKDGYKLALMIKKFEEALKVVKSTILDTVIDELKQPYEWSGFRFEQTQSGRYTYDHYDEWKRLKVELKDIEDSMKMAHKSNKSIVNEQGEIIPPANYKPNKISYKITKNK